MQVPSHCCRALHLITTSYISCSDRVIFSDVFRSTVSHRGLHFSAQIMLKTQFWEWIPFIDRDAICLRTRHMVCRSSACLWIRRQGTIILRAWNGEQMRGPLRFMTISSRRATDLYPPLTNCRRWRASTYLFMQSLVLSFRYAEDMNTINQVSKHKRGQSS